MSYRGLPGVGAWRDTEGARAEEIHVAARAGGTVRVVGSRSHRGDSLDAFLARVGPHELLPVGSSLKFCMVAEGAADVYPRLGPTNEWDTAAAHAVVTGAGGTVSRLDGEPLRYNTREELLRTPVSQIHPAERAQMSDFLERVLSDGQASTIKLTCRTKIGTFLPTEMSLHAFENGGRLRTAEHLLQEPEHERRLARRRPGDDRPQRGFGLRVPAARDSGARLQRDDVRIARVEFVGELIDLLVPPFKEGASGELQWLGRAA